jgi:hypothetical protein
MRVQVQGFSGYCHKSFDLTQNWHAIKAGIESSKPVYSVNNQRKTFLVNIIPGTTVYAKVVNEDVDGKGPFINRLTSSEARRYLRNYLLLEKYRIMSPQVLFILEKREWLTISKSIIATSNFQGFEPWPQFFVANSGKPRFYEMKQRALEEIAQFAARLHAMGIYFSMDGRNLLLKSILGKPGENIGIIDLDHVKIWWFGKIPERRRLRSLRRFDRTLLKTAGMLPPDYELFLKSYHTYLEER